jgi:hypothetical protein
MHLQYAALCDQIIISADGRPSLIGVFDNLQVMSLPALVPRVSFAARILFTNHLDDKPLAAAQLAVRLADHA